MRFSSLVSELSARMRQRSGFVLLFVLLAPCAIPAAPAPKTTERLQTLAQTMTFEWAKLHPLTATLLGLSDEDGRLDTPSEAENARDLAKIRGWESELASIPLEGASLGTLRSRSPRFAQVPLTKASASRIGFECHNC